MAKARTHRESKRDESERGREKKKTPQHISKIYNPIPRSFVRIPEIEVNLMANRGRGNTACRVHIICRWFYCCYRVYVCVLAYGAQNALVYISHTIDCMVCAAREQATMSCGFCNSSSTTTINIIHLLKL